jgi:hypothetical protein
MKSKTRKQINSRRIFAPQDSPQRATNGVDEHQKAGKYLLPLIIETAEKPGIRMLSAAA